MMFYVAAVNAVRDRQSKRFLERGVSCIMSMFTPSCGLLNDFLHECALHNMYGYKALLNDVLLLMSA